MDDDIEIKVANREEVPALAGLRTAWLSEKDSRDDTAFEQTFRDWYEAEASRRVFWLATLAGDPVGMVNLVVFDRMPTPGRPAGGWGYLSNMYVRAEHRDAGIGTLLIEALLAHADSLGLDRVVLNPTERSIALYGRNQFRSATELMLRPQRPT
jgi:GNAT superfamily N-acetyltransferase